MEQFMKKMILMAATGLLASSLALADTNTTNPNDVLQTLPNNGSNETITIADASNASSAPTAATTETTEPKANATDTKEATKETKATGKANRSTNKNAASAKHPNTEAMMPKLLKKHKKKKHHRLPRVKLNKDTAAPATVTE
jgi:hypothetical protein